MKCPNCNGEGYIDYDVAEEEDVETQVGFLYTEECELCEGLGEINEGKLQ